MEQYLSPHKLSESRRKNFKVIIRSLKRFELFKRKSTRGYKIIFTNLTPEILREIEYYFGNEKEAFF